MPYPNSLVAAMISGKGRTMNGRLLLRAVSLEEIRGLSGGGGLDLSALADNPRKAQYHEVIIVGDGVPEGFAKPGDLCLHISAAADIADPSNESTPYTFVRHDHIIAVVDPVVALVAESEAEEAKAAEDEARRRAANGL